MTGITNVIVSSSKAVRACIHPTNYVPRKKSSSIDAGMVIDVALKLYLNKYNIEQTN